MESLKGRYEDLYGDQIFVCSEEATKYGYILATLNDGRVFKFTAAYDNEEAMNKTYGWADKVVLPFNSSEIANLDFSKNKENDLFEKSKSMYPFKPKLPDSIKDKIIMFKPKLPDSIKDKSITFAKDLKEKGGTDFMATLESILSHGNTASEKINYFTDEELSSEQKLSIKDKNLVFPEKPIKLDVEFLKNMRCLDVSGAESTNKKKPT